MRWLFLLVGAVALASIGWTWLVCAVLSDAEAERMDLAARGRRCGLNPRA